MTTCRVEGCERTNRVTRGLCNAHYQRVRFHGDALAHVPIGTAWQLQWHTEPDETAVERAMSGDAPAVLSVSERHLAVTRLTERGLSAARIADRLGCTKRTVQRHRAPRLAAS